VVDHAWLRSRLAGGGLESMSPHEVEGALSWLRAKLLESSGSFVHRGDVELHAAAALEAIPPSVLPGHTHSRSEQVRESESSERERERAREQRERERESARALRFRTRSAPHARMAWLVWTPGFPYAAARLCRR
jgi:hypothetical protein